MLLGMCNLFPFWKIIKLIFKFVLEMIVKISEKPIEVGRKFCIISGLFVIEVYGQNAQRFHPV